MGNKFLFKNERETNRGKDMKTKTNAYDIKSLPFVLYLKGTNRFAN